MVYHGGLNAFGGGEYAFGGGESILCLYSWKGGGNGSLPGVLALLGP